MELLKAVGLLIGGFTVLIIGGEALVKSAVSIAGRMKISPTVVGLTVVAAGTSAPELLTSLIASLKGTPDIAVGNVVGSNIFNLLVISGLTCLIQPLVVEKRLFKNELPQLCLFSLVFAYFAWDNMFTKIEGIMFLILLIISLYHTLMVAKNEDSTEADELEILKTKYHDILFLAIGMTALVVGADIALEGGKAIGVYFGISERIIGIAIISVGTGLPELVTSAVASYRNQNEIALSNVIGSNIMNTLAVTGASATIINIPVSQQLAGFDSPIMLALTLAFVPLIWLSGFKLSRLHGFGLIITYSVYLYFMTNR